jgi:hypothetical protein
MLKKLQMNWLNRGASPSGVAACAIPSGRFFLPALSRLMELCRLAALIAAARAEI